MRIRLTGIVGATSGGFIFVADPEDDPRLEAIVIERAESPGGGPLVLHGHTCRIASIKFVASGTFWKLT